MRTALAFALLSTACTANNAPTRHDKGTVCAVPGSSDSILEVQASSDDCSSDHEGVKYSCDVTVDGDVVTVTTTYVPGEDPDDGCPGPSTASCEMELEPGDYTITFGGESWEITMPLDEPLCIPGGGNNPDTGW